MRKILKSSKKFFKFSVIFFFIAVFAFSNFTSYILNKLGEEKMARNFEIKIAHAAVADDAASESHTGITGSTNQASFTWTHTPAGTSRGVLVFVYTISATKKVTSVTYGGVVMTEITGGVAIDTANEPGRVDTFFLGASVPIGAQSIIVNRTNDATVMYASAVTQTAGTDTEVYTPGIVLLQENGVYAEQLVDDGLPGTNSQRYAAGYSGGADILAAGAASTVINSIDFGVYTITTAKETVVGQGSRSVGFAAATADDRAAVHLAIREIPPPITLTIGQTAGTKVTTKNSGAVDQYSHDIACTGAASCAAFTLAAGGGAVNVTSIKVTESGTVTANTELSDVNLYYDTDGNWSDAAAETLFGTAATLAADQTAIINGALTVFASQTAYIYVRYDLANGAVYPIGGATVNWQIAAASDVVSDGTESGSGTLAGTQTVLPNVTSITSYPDATQLGGKVSQTVSLAGAGFGTTCNVAGGNKVSIGAYDLSCTSATFTNTTISIPIDSGINVYGGTGANGLLVTIGSTADDARQEYHVLPSINQVNTPSISNAARIAENITFTNSTASAAKFGATKGTVTFSGGFGSVSVPSGDITWADTSITVVVPTAIADNVYLGDITITRAADANSKTATAYGGNAFRILPRIISTTPVNLKGGRGGTIAIAGDHLCQSGAASCPTVFDVNNKVSFIGGDVTSGASTWTNTSIPSIVIPATATDGNLNITSRDTGGAINYVSNNLTYDIKFAPITPTGSSGGGSNNPTLSGSAFSDSSDSPADSHSKTQWQLAHNTDADWATPEWSRITATGLISAVVDTSDSGAFANGDVGQTALDCGTTYKGRTRYMDNGNGGADTQTWEWSSYSANYTFSTASCNAAPSISISQPPAGNINVNQGDSYNITYTLSDSDDIVVANFYYDTNNSGLDGASITGCQSQAEGTNVICAWNTTGYPLGTYYVYGTSTDGINPQVNAYSAGTITIQAPPQVTASSVGTQSVNLDSGAGNQYIGAAFTFQQNNGTADTITALTISETGSVNANANLSVNAGIRYESAVASCVYNGTETLVSDTFDITTDKMTLTGLTIPVTVGSNYTCVYVVFDIASSTVGGQTIDLEITSSADFILSGGTTKAGTYPVQITGSTAVRPNVTSISYPQSTDGGRNGNTFTINGAGFGTSCASISAQIQTTALTCVSANNTVATTTIPSGQTTTYGGTGASGLLMTVGGTADDTRQTFYIYPFINNIASIVSNADREGNDIILTNSTANNARFGASQGTGGVTFTGGFGSVSATIVSWSDISVTVTVPTGIADNVYLGDITLTRDSVTGSKADSAYDSNGFRILPRIISTNPTSPIKGENVEIIGNHLCQAGAASCPGVGSRSTTVNNVKFYNNVQVADGDVTAWVNGDSGTNGVAVIVPITAQSSGNLILRSNDYDSNNLNITLASTVPNDPDVGPGTNKGQFKSDGTTAISINGGTNETSLVFMASSSAQVSVNLQLQVEVDPIGVPFTEDNIITGSAVSYSGTPVTASTTVSGLSTSTPQYHWRARLKNVGTNEFSNWVAFGGNPSGNGSTDGSPAATDFYIDSSVAIINVCEVSPTATTCDSSIPSDIQAQIRWETSGGENATKWVRYSNAGGTCPSGSTAADVFNALPNTEPTSESSLTSSPLSVVLNGLTASSIYKYKIKSTDAFGNIAYYPSDTTCEELQTTTAKNRLMKTLEFYIEQSATTGNTFTKTFDVFISESKADGSNIFIQSAFVEAFGISKVDSGDITVGIYFQSGLTPTGTVNYTVSPGGTTPIYWTLNRNATNLDWDRPGDNSHSNQISITVSGINPITSLLGAKIYVTYYYEPQI